MAHGAWGACFSSKPCALLSALCAMLFALCALPQRCAQNLLLRCFSSVKLGLDTSLVHDQNTIAHAENLGQFRRKHHDTHALCRELVHELVDFHFGTYVNAAGAFVKNQDIGGAAEPFAEHHFLLIAAAEM